MGQGCRRECESSRDCSQSQECQRFKCVPVCREGVCGENANCQARNNRAQCTCPPDFLGDGHTRCYTECTKHDDCSRDQACVKFKCRDPCREPDPNVCGQGAQCQPGNDRSGSDRPVCTCPPGTRGDPLRKCN